MLAREAAGLSQRDLAAKSGVPQSTIARVERGSNTSVDTLNKLVDITSLVNAPKLRKVKMLSVKSMTKESVYAVLDNLNVEELLCFGGKAEISDIHINRKNKE
jgi:transcriptional regulator with XRE-family HTH domain